MKPFKQIETAIVTWIAFAGCAGGDMQPFTADSDARAADTGSPVQFADARVGGDLSTGSDLGPRPDLGTGSCAGLGCPCIDDGPCIAGADQTVCGSNGTCQPGCNNNVPCADTTQTCCGGQCISGCCGNSDCLVDEGCAPDATCRKTCTVDSDCGDDTCCAGYCYGDGCVMTLTGSGRVGPADSIIAETYINGVDHLAPDGKGNVFFTESIATTVRVVNRSNSSIGRVAPGTVGHLTGGVHGCKAGPADTAEMRRPMGIAFGDDGRLFVADYNCAVIWELSADFSQVRILAGDPHEREIKDGVGSEAHFRYPRGLTFGPDQRLYVSEHNDHLIRQVALDGTVKTVAGTGTAGQQDGSALTEAQFFYPIGVAMDSGGALFVGDYHAGTVRKVDGLTNDSTPQVYTLDPYDLDQGIERPATTATPEDDDPRAEYVWKRTYGYSSHGNIAVGSGQELYINFWGNGIWHVYPRSGTSWNFAQILPGDHVITQALDPADPNMLWLGGWNYGPPTSSSNTIKLFDLQKKETLFTAGLAGRMGVADGSDPSFMFPACEAALTVDDKDNVWIADRCANKVRKVSPDGSVKSYGTGEPKEVAGNAASAKFSYPSAIAVHKGYVYVANIWNGRHIMRIDPSSDSVEVLGTTCPASENGIGETGQNLCPHSSLGGGIVFDEADNLYLTTYWEPGAGRSPTFGPSYWDGMPMIVKIPKSDAGIAMGPAVFFAGTRNNPHDPSNRNACRDGPLGQGQLGQSPYGLAIDATGYLYVGDSSCGVRKIGPDGSISTLESEFGTIAVSIGPGPAGEETLFASRGNQIYTVDRITGTTAWYAGEANAFSFADHVRDGARAHARFWGVHSMAHASGGDLYVLDNYNGRVRIVRR